MISTPQARATSTTPAPTSDVARLVACWLDPHWLSTVVAATDCGRPAESHAVRAMLKLCSPTWLTHPPTTWPISAGSIPDRSITASCTAASSSAGWTLDRPPPRRPTGVRSASTITTSVMAAAYGEFGLYGESRERSVRPHGPAAGHPRGGGIALVPRSGQPRVGGRVALRGRGGADLRRHAGHHGVLGRGDGAGRRRARRRHVQRPARPVRPAAGGAVDGGRASGPARRLGPHPPLLWALRHADRALGVGAVDEMPALRPARLPPSRSGGHHPREPGRGGAPRPRGDLPGAHVLLHRRVRGAGRDAGGGGQAGGARGGGRGHHQSRLRVQPAVAVPAFAHARLHRRLGQW